MKRYSKMDIVAIVLILAITCCSTIVLASTIGPAIEPEQSTLSAEPSTEHRVPEHQNLTYTQETVPETTGEAQQKPQLDWHDAVSDDEAIILAQTIYNEAQVMYWTGDRYGVSYPARQAAVAWCALNRLDTGNFGDSLGEVLAAPHQFAYAPDAPVTDHMLRLAEDVLTRWWAEKNGCNNVGRTLPQGYIYFSGYDGENHFRDEYHADFVWDWSLPDPYAEDWR